MRALNRLTARKVATIKEPGRYADGGSLFLQVRSLPGNPPRISRVWVMRYAFAGRQHDMGLGPAHDVSLERARELAKEAREVLRQGRDPIRDRDDRNAAYLAAQGQRRTFAEAVDAFLFAKEGNWRNEKHRGQWRATLDNYAGPLKAKLVDTITTEDVLDCLKPIWNTKTETAVRLRGRIESVLAFATVRNWRRGDNPARWKGHLETSLPKPSRVAPVEHHPSLPWSEIGAFTALLRERKGTAARALEFAILTGARTGEVKGATWGEIDMAERVWTIPASRMKAGKEHSVPLTDRAIELLAAVRPARPAAAALVFTREGTKHKLSENALLAVLKRMERRDITPHGFRSTFRTWIAEQTNFPREIAEAALAHTVKGVEGAYQRGDLLARRRKLMEAWATYCAKVPKPTTDNVTSIATARRGAS